MTLQEVRSMPAEEFLSWLAFHGFDELIKKKARK